MVVQYLLSNQKCDVIDESSVQQWCCNFNMVLDVLNENVDNEWIDIPSVIIDDLLLHVDEFINQDQCVTLSEIRIIFF